MDEFDEVSRVCNEVGDKSDPLRMFRAMIGLMVFMRLVIFLSRVSAACIPPVIRLGKPSMEPFREAYPIAQSITHPPSGCWDQCMVITNPSVTVVAWGDRSTLAIIRFF